MGDEGRPLGAGLREQASNHLKPMLREAFKWEAPARMRVPMRGAGAGRAVAP